MTRQTAEIDFNEETIKVIGYREDGLWYALGLEVSILGHGETFKEAVSLLEELIQDQIEFCNETPCRIITGPRKNIFSYMKN